MRLQKRYYEKWSQADTPDKRRAVISEVVGWYDDAVTVAFEFLSALGYGTPAISHRHLENTWEADGNYNDVPCTEVSYRNQRGRSVTVTVGLLMGFALPQVKLCNTDTDSSFTYDGYRRYAKRRDTGIKYYEIRANETQDLSEYMFRAVKDDFSGPLKAVVMGDGWLEISPESKSAPVPDEEEAPPAVAMFSANPPVFAVARKGIGLELWSAGKTTEIRRSLKGLSNITCWKNLTLYCRAPYVCVAENYGLNALLWDTETGRSLPLSREDYQSGHCRYPIAFAELDGKAILIHGTTWNRIDFTRLEDFAPLTPRELTKENSEDYFLSSLALSPEGGQFASNGWVWGPMDRIYVFDKKRFLADYEKAGNGIESFEGEQTGYNWDRPCCWMAEGTLAVGHNPDEGEKGNRPSVIELYDTSEVTHKPYKWVDQDDKVVGEGVNHFYKRIKSIPFNGFDISREEEQDPSFTPVYNEVRGSLYYDSQFRVFITVGEQKGLYITDEEGKTLVEEGSYKDWRYAPEFQMFFKLYTSPELAFSCRGLKDVLKAYLSRGIIKNHLMRFLPIMAALAIGCLALSFIVKSIIPVPCALIVVYAIYFYQKRVIEEDFEFHYDMIYKIDRENNIVLEKNGVDIMTIKGDAIIKIEEYRNGSITIYANSENPLRSHPEETHIGTYFTNYSQFLNALRNEHKIDKLNKNEINLIVESGMALLSPILHVVGMLIIVAVWMYYSFKDYINRKRGLPLL